MYEQQRGKIFEKGEYNKKIFVRDWEYSFYLLLVLLAFPTRKNSGQLEKKLSTYSRMKKVIQAIIRCLNVLKR